MNHNRRIQDYDLYVSAVFMQCATGETYPMDRKERKGVLIGLSMLLAINLLLLPSVFYESYIWDILFLLCLLAFYLYFRSHRRDDGTDEPPGKPADTDPGQKAEVQKPDDPSVNSDAESSAPAAVGAREAQAEED